MESAWAKELNATHIGNQVWFDWYFPGSNVKAEIKGELQEILHDASYTYLTLVGEGASDTEDFRVEHATLMFLPKKDG